MSKTPEEMAEEYCEDHDECEFACDAYLAGYQAAKEETNFVTPGKWISVKDRLPEPNTLVVILHEDEMNLNYRKPPVYFGKHDGKYWLETLDHSDVAWQGPCRITHWLSLPAPPEEEK